MASPKAESLDSEPAIKATSSNKQLLQRNMRASDNWLKARKALEREKKEFETRVSMDKNALLKQRERLHSISFNLDTLQEVEDSRPTSTVSTPRAPVVAEKRRMTLADVYDSLIRSVREQNSSGDTRSVVSEPHSKTSTTSFENKRVTRKPVKFSLQSLQRAQSNLQEKLETLNQPQNEVNDRETQSEPTSPKGFFDLSEAEKSLGPTLRLPPTTLPPIRSQAVFKPRTRSFDRRATRQTAKGSEPDIDEIQYCRYIRGAVKGTNRRNSAPIVRQTRQNINRHANKLQ